MDEFELIILDILSTEERADNSMKSVIAKLTLFPNTTFYQINNDYEFGEAFKKILLLRNKTIVIHFLGGIGGFGVMGEKTTHISECIHWEIVLEYFKQIKEYGKENRLIINMLANPFSYFILDYAKPHQLDMIFVCEEEYPFTQLFCEESTKIYEENFDFISFKKKHDNNDRFHAYYPDRASNKLVEIITE